MDYLLLQQVLLPPEIAHIGSMHLCNWLADFRIEPYFLLYALCVLSPQKRNHMKVACGDFCFEGTAFGCSLSTQ
jgi:hypothetical protein